MRCCYPTTYARSAARRSDLLRTTVHGARALDPSSSRIAPQDHRRNGRSAVEGSPSHSMSVAPNGNIALLIISNFIAHSAIIATC